MNLSYNKIACMLLSSVLFQGAEGRMLPESDRCQLRALEVSYYEVSGDSTKALQESLLAHGPLDASGVKRHAFTIWSVDWRWPIDSQHHPDFKKVEVWCNARIMMPRLQNQETRYADLNAVWNRYVVQVATHEWNHLEHVLRDAPRIGARIRQAASKRAAFSIKDAHAVAAETIAEMNLWDRRYDQETVHGETEGIYLPIELSER